MNRFVTRHPVAVLVLLLLLLLCFLVSAVNSIFPTLGSGLANALSGTSYASEDTDLLGVDEDYTALENELAQTVANIESTHPGYDEYRYSVDEIGHNPYELASYLSAKYHVYFREQVQHELAPLVLHGMTSVVAALIARNNIILLADQIDHAALALVAPVDTRNCSKHNK